MAYTDVRADIVTGGIDSVYIKWVGDDAFYPIPLIRDGEMTLETQQTNDTRQRNFPHSVMARLTFKTFAVDVANLLKQFENISVGPIHFFATGIGGTTYSTRNIDASTGYFGLTWRYVCEGDFNSEQYIEFTFARRLTLAQYQLLINTDAAGYGSPNALDQLYFLNGTLTRADIKPASITKLEWGAGSYSNVATTIRGGSFTATQSAISEDSIGRPIGTAVTINVSVELMQSTPSELGELDGYAAADNDYRLTLGDGSVITFDSLLGISWTHRNGGNADGQSSIILNGSGVLTLSQFTTIWP